MMSVNLEEKFRETGGKRPYVQRLFGRIARVYDPMNRLMSLGLDQRWRAVAARHLALGSGEVGLDLGAGTADLSIAAIRHAGPGARMIGMDITTEMMEVGRVKVTRPAGYSAPSFISSFTGSPRYLEPSSARPLKNTTTCLSPSRTSPERPR